MNEGAWDLLRPTQQRRAARTLTQNRTDHRTSTVGPLRRPTEGSLSRTPRRFHAHNAWRLVMKKLVIVSTVVLCLALPAMAAPGGPPSHAAPSPADTLKQDMRKLWTDHVVWTRNYIVAALGDQPDAQAAANRLMKNQEEIGNAVGAIYGAPAGQQLTTLLKEHISIAVDLVKAAKAGDKGGQQKADARWQQNGVAIADFLSKANPNWPRATLVDLMKGHLTSTTNEVVARLTKNWDADVRAYDDVYRHILMMSDALSDGIVKQFPNKFNAGVASTTGKK